MSTVAPSMPASAGPAEQQASVVPSAGARAPLTKGEIVARLNAVTSPAVISDVYDIAQRQVQFEVGRQTRLDGKATSLLTAVGLSVTVALAFGGQVLLTRHEEVRRLVQWAWTPIVVLFGVAVLCGLLAGGFALWALLVGDKRRGVSEAVVFDPRFLAGSNDAGEGRETAFYRVALAAHLWVIAQANAGVHHRKGNVIKCGQLAFGGFIASLVVICVLVVLGWLTSS